MKQLLVNLWKKIIESRKTIWWVVLTVACGFALIGRYPCIVNVGDLAPLDKVLVGLGVVLLLWPLVSEIGILGLKLKKEIDNVKSDFNEKIHKLRFDFSVNQKMNVYVGFPPPDPDRVPKSDAKTSGSPKPTFLAEDDQQGEEKAASPLDKKSKVTENRATPEIKSSPPKPIRRLSNAEVTEEMDLVTIANYLKDALEENASKVVSSLGHYEMVSKYAQYPTILSVALDHKLLDQEQYSVLFNLFSACARISQGEAVDEVYKQYILKSGLLSAEVIRKETILGHLFNFGS